jgi:hypothetical protein
MSAYAPTLSGVSREPEAPKATHGLTRDEVMIAREVAELLKIRCRRSTSLLAAASCQPAGLDGRGVSSGPGSKTSSRAGWIRQPRQVWRRTPRAERGPRAR